MVEFIGYIGIFVVIISFLFENNKIFRLINTVGCIWFIIYGVLIYSKIVIIINSIIAVINLYKLNKEFTDNE